MSSISQEVWMVMGGSLFFAIVAIGIIILVLVYQKRQLLYKLEKTALQNQFEQELLKTHLETQEETLSHVGRELHDNIGQLLNSAALLLSMAQRNQVDAESVPMARETVVKAIQEIRSLSKSLDPQWLKQFSLLENLRAEASRLNTSKEFQMTISLPEQIELPPEQQLILFRMVQEAFQNSIKHGKAANIIIKVRQESGYCLITVSDNGNGFSLESAQAGLGITNIKTRAALLGGSAHWLSGQDGTQVEIKIPLTIAV